MKYLIIILILVASLAVYLNRSYAAFYDKIGSEHLGPPTSQRTFLIEASPSAQVSQHKKTTLKYIAMGASTTAGVGTTDYHYSYPYLVAQKLLSSSFEVTMENFGIPGVESSNVLDYQTPKAVAEDPDYVSVDIGINDIHNLRSLDEYKNNMTQILEELKTKTHAKIMVINNPILGAENWSFPYDKLLDYRTQQFNAALKKIANSENVRYIDLYSDTKKQFLSSERLYAPDHFHPNDQGYIYWSQFINVN